MFVLCLGKRRDHSGRYRQYPAFVPTKSLQNLSFIGRAWPKFPSFYSTYQKNPNKNHPQVRALCRVCCVLLFEIPGVSNAKGVRSWFCFYVQIRTAWHVRASSPAPDLVSRVVPLKVTRLSSLVPRRSPVVSWINAKDMTQTKGRIRYPSRRQ